MLVAPAGASWMFASTQILFALSLPPGAEFTTALVMGGIVIPLTGMFALAWTTVSATLLDGIVTVQLAVSAPPVSVRDGPTTRLRGPERMLAVGVCGPGWISPPGAFTVIVNT